MFRPLVEISRLDSVAPRPESPARCATGPGSFPGEQGALQSRFEFINAFNHTRFGSPTLTLTSSSFGQISAPTGNYRIIQIALKALF